MNQFLELDEKEQKKIIEAIIFAADETLTIKNLISILEGYYQSDSEVIVQKMSVQMIEEIIEKINNDLEESGRPFRIVNFAGGVQFAVIKQYGEIIARLIKSKSKKRLSQAALEALAIIAYKQPISKPLVEQIRGVNSNEVVNTLIDKGFVKIAGRSDAIGKPLLYGTTDDFLKHFGLKSLKELPPLKEIDELSIVDNIEPEGEIVIEVDSVDALPELQKMQIEEKSVEIDE
jgi:segregation and condensation protein B